MITDDDIRFAIEVAKRETDCIESRALKILHERHGMMEVHNYEAAERLRGVLASGATDQILAPATPGVKHAVKSLNPLRIEREGGHNAVLH